ncbi:MAG: hypothetical protein IJP95_05075 [Bacteroidales bacterium]|nr:hypothetical protein [Bacteroidales bacterium]
MSRTRLFIICLLLCVVYGSVAAQTKKTTQRTKKKAKTTTVKKDKQKPVAADTVQFVVEKKVPKHKTISDPLVLNYLIGGFAEGGKIYLMTDTNYAELSIEKKKDILNRVAKEFPKHDMVLRTGGQQRELWIATPEGLSFVEQWNNDSLKVEDYSVMELKRNGSSNIFYYFGGTFSGSEGTHNGTLGLRIGSYLYKNVLDASVTLNLGYSKMDEQAVFLGDVGLDGRWYFPLRKSKVNITPYAGTGISWTFSPESYFEMRFLAGGCWFVGPGSFDIGFQYGLKSGFSTTLGYTYRPSIKKRK